MNISDDWNYIKISKGGKKIFRPDIIKIEDNNHSYLITVRESGKRKLFYPEKSIQVQFDIGSDVIICLDDFTPPDADESLIKSSVDRTILWAEKCKKEYEKIKQHPGIGAEIIRNIHFLSRVVPIVLYHHERFDGLGYSAGMKGKEIPLGARIIAVADVYQALISNRPYRKAYSKEEALKIVKEEAGTHFDPEVVKVFLAIMNRDIL